MMKTKILTLALLSLSTTAFATEDAIQSATFDSIKPHRESFKDKYIQIEGKVKDLKMIKEGGNKFATFFLSEGGNPETTISVKVNLSKKKIVINTFACKDGDFTTVKGRFKPWGTASYLGKIEIREAEEFVCSQTASVKKIPPVVVAKKESPKKPEVVEKKIVETDVPKPIILKIGSDGTNKVVDAKGKEITKSGSTLEPGTVIKTGAHSFVQLKYPDGSKVSIGANSQLMTEAGTKAVQSVNLKFGKLQALIHKQESSEVHFKVKTKSATMGVRGTRFFVDENAAGKVSTHVIEGRVDVAKDDATLFSGKGRHVLHDEYVDVVQGKVSEAKHFNAAEYLEKTKAEQPELVAFADQVADEEEAAPVAVKAPAKGIVREESSEKSELLVFRLAPLVYLTKNVNPTFTAMLSWNPETHLIGNWKIGLDLGYTNVKWSASTRASVFEYALAGSFSFNSSLAAEIKAGAQSWLSPASVTGGMGGLALKYSLCDSCPVNHILIGDDILSLGNATFNIARIGIGFQF